MDYHMQFGDHGEPKEHWVCKVSSSQHAPAILAAFHDSHDVAAKIYTQTFGTLGAKPSLWFSYAQDTLYLSLQVLLEIQKSEFLRINLGVDFSKVERLF
jgi:hypothetical protein